MQAVILIRKQGLKYRMSSPKQFVRQMNRLYNEMTHPRKTEFARKVRKQVFRRMKKLMKTMGHHAENCHRLLKENRRQTDWSELETASAVA
jgi:hypothetical protein